MAGKRKYEKVNGKWRCSSCTKMKAESEFSAQNNSRGLQYSCKECANSYRRERRKNPANAAKDRLASRKQELKRNYGLSWDEYNLMLDEQNFKCLICNDDIDSLGRDLDVDHCHECNAIRALLCGPCNKGLGCFKDSIYRLEKALEYLKNHIHSE